MANEDLFCLEPSVPRSLEVNFLSPSSLEVKWRKPYFPNGEITHYVVRYKESQSSDLWNINIDWCKIIDSSGGFYNAKEKDENSEGTRQYSRVTINRQSSSVSR